MKRLSPDCFLSEVELAVRHRTLTLFVGAGVSMLPPSQLPSAWDLKVLAVKALCKPRGLARYAKVILRSPRLESLVLEVLVQRLHESFKEQVFSLFACLRANSPNIAHWLLARLSDKFDIPLVTTNFDLLIEQCQSRPKQIVHLHGDLGNHEEMVTRIYQVGRGLSDQMAQTFQKRIRGRTLCVLGYSGTDEDVRALLTKLPPSNILWLLRDESGLAFRNLNRFFSKTNLSYTVTDLRNFCLQLHSRFRIPPSRPSSKSISCKGYWNLSAARHQRLAAISDVFIEIEDYKRAAQVADAGFKICPRTERPSWYAIQATEAFRILGDSRSAFTRAKRAIAAAQRFGTDWDVAAALNAMGLVFLEKRRSEPRQALPYFKAALKRNEAAIATADASPFWESIHAQHGRFYNNLGLCYLELKKFDKARRAFLLSIRAKRTLGDLIGIGVTSGNLAISCLRALKRERARFWKRKAIELNERYAQSFRSAYVLRRYGVISCEQGRRKSGLRDLQKALEIYTNLFGSGLGVELTQRAIKKYAVSKREQ